MKCPIGLCLAALATAPLLAQDYTFTLNGEAITPSGVHLQGSAGKWAEGDVIFVDGFTLLIGKPGAWHFRSHKALKDVLTREQGGKESPVAMRIENVFGGNGERKGLNPLEALDAAGRAGLRGLSIDAPAESLADVLKDLPAAQLALEISEDIFAKGDKSLPNLPAELTWLTVQDGSIDGFENLDTLAGLTALRGLKLRLFTDKLLMPGC